jgi:Phosphoglucose isomerase
MKELKDYLFEAVNKGKDEIPSENPYSRIGFDSGSKRLGWVASNSFLELKKSIESIGVLEGKENFIFVGMGGSVNGIKPLIALYKASNCHTIDSLDPRAMSLLLDSIDDFKKTLVISISKSGTTRETQLLTSTLRDTFIGKVGNELWQDHFLWLSDPASFEKLDALGWPKVAKAPIQINRDSDIGGRFSSPHTLIFLLPLFLLLGKDMSVFKNIYETFTGLMEEIANEAFSVFKKHQDKNNAYFAPCTDNRLGDSFSSWIVQLFQESLGSKQEGLEVKTITNLRNDKIFTEIELSKATDDPTVALMSQMYFFQVFIAFYAGVRNLNFVNQEYVEKYKNQMRELEGQSHKASDIELISEEKLIKIVKENCRPEHKTIEIVLYFYPDKEKNDSIYDLFSREFPDKHVLIFIGSDWNHQSYQAAFGSEDTFFVLLSAADYENNIEMVNNAAISKNIETLILIAKATYMTIENKAILFSVLSSASKE